MTARTTVVKYVRLHEAEDWLRLGWCPSLRRDGCAIGREDGRERPDVAHPFALALAGTYHGQFSMLMTWLCGCPIAQPARRIHDDAPLFAQRSEAAE